MGSEAFTSPTSRASRSCVLAVATFSLACAAACSRTHDAAAGDANDAAPSGTPRDAAADAPRAPAAGSAGDGDAASSAPSPSHARGEAAPRAIASSVEARHSRIGRAEADRVLAPFTAEVRTHFGGELPPRLAVQIADLTVGRRRAVLVADDAKPPSESAPFVVVTGDDRAPIWTKEKPAAGIMAPIGPIGIAPGPLGRVVFAACDPPTASVALRVWDDDGSPFADFSVLGAPTCDAISVLYWPRRGWIVVAASAGVTRAQLLGETGSVAWGRGVEIGARPPVASPAAIATDTETTFVLAQRLERSPGAGAHVLAFRYDAGANALWPAPIDLGPTTLAPGDRITLERPRVGVVRVTLEPGRDVEIGSNGEIVHTTR